MEADLGYSFPMGSIQANVNNTICFDCQSNCTIDYPGLAFYGISGYSFGNTFNANLQYDLGSSSNQLTFCPPIITSKPLSLILFLLSITAVRIQNPGITLPTDVRCVLKNIFSLIRIIGACPVHCIAIIVQIISLASAVIYLIVWMDQEIASFFVI